MEEGEIQIDHHEARLLTISHVSFLQQHYVQMSPETKSSPSHSFSKFFAEKGAGADVMAFVTFSQQDDILWGCLSIQSIKLQNYWMKRGKKHASVWVSDFVEGGGGNPWFQNEPLADVGRVLSPPRPSWDLLRVSSMWPEHNLSWRFLGSCFLSATQSVYPLEGKHTGFLVQKVKGNT